MTDSDFTSSAIVSITPDNDKVHKWQSNLPHYVIDFLREIYKCPECSSPAFTKKRTTSRHIYAIVKGEPSECKITRKEYNCNNSECTLEGCFYNTHGHEDGFFDGRKCTYHFVYYILTQWLTEKTLSFDDIEEKYAISGNEADIWSLSLREEFDSHFDVPTQSVMMFCSFVDKDGRERGFVGTPSDGGKIQVLSFIEDYTCQGLQDFYKRIKIKFAVKNLYYDGSNDIGSKLSDLFGVHATPSKELNILKLDMLKRDIVKRVNKKDSYDSIVIKYLYDSPLCKDKIFSSLRKASLKHGMTHFNWKGGYQSLPLFSLIDRYTRKGLLEEFKELPRVSGYYTEY